MEGGLAIARLSDHAWNYDGGVCVLEDLGQQKILSWSESCCSFFALGG
jgi:hypothetical protein